MREIFSEGEGGRVRGLVGVSWIFVLILGWFLSWLFFREVCGF